MDMCLIPIKNDEEWMKYKRICDYDLYIKQNNAAITIQKAFRFFIQKKKINKIIINIYNDYAIIIQKAYRHYKSKKLKT